MQTIHIKISFSGKLTKQGAKNIIEHTSEISGTIKLKNAYAKDRKEIAKDIQEMLLEDVAYNTKNYPEKYQDIKISVK